MATSVTRPTPEEGAAEVLCADCAAVGLETPMVEDNGCGYLCPTCDQHFDCSGFPCSGEGGETSCALSGGDPA